MKALIKIINLHFWKSIIGPFFAFVFPIIFIAILGTMLGYYSMFGGLLAISSMAVSLTSMPQAIFEFKRSSLLKRIGVTPIKPWMFLVITTIFYFIVMILGTIFSIVIGIAIFSGNMDVGKQISEIYPGASGQHPLFAYSLKDLLSNINWGGFFWGLILNILIGVSLGMFLVSFSKTTVMIQGLGIPILILSQFLSAQVLPLYMVRDIDAIWYLGYISPFKSSTALMLQSWNPSLSTEIFDVDKYIQQINGPFNVFDMNAEYKMMSKEGEVSSIVVFSVAERYLNMFMPFLWIGLFGGMSLKFFKWSTRG